METAEFIPFGYTVLRDLGKVQVLTWDDGTLGIRHSCKVTHDSIQLITAPKLAEAHKITWDGDALSVWPSIMCDCGLHGWITDGRWVDC